MKKKILLITTGGTIASRSGEGGLSPQMSAEEILRHVPSVPERCRVESLPLYNLDSTNMEPRHWLGMAHAVRAHYDDYDGFVILHGTDTMSYSAAALSYLMQDLGKPVVLTGAQRPVDKEVTDAKRNLTDSFLYAADDDSFGVSVVFDGGVIAGTRARKSRTKSFNAFSSIDYPNLAVLRDGAIVRYIRDKRPAGAPVFYDRLNDRVFVLKLIPGMNPVVLRHLRPYYDALIIESFGVGGIPCYERDSFMGAIDAWAAAGGLLVMTTQVPHEGSDMGLYNVGVRVKERFDLIEAYDMTLEATVTKLMWILGQTTDYRRVRELFYRPINHDIIV